MKLLLKSKIDISSLFRINEKQGILRERDAHIANLEVEINEVLSKLNILQNEKGKLMDNEAVSNQSLPRRFFIKFTIIITSLGIQI